MGVLGGIIRFIFFKIDEIVFNFITLIYGLLLDISRITVLNAAIDPFFDRIYSLLCIFMLFKISFSILTYIVNPDDFVDKNKGLTKVITNVVLTLVMLVFIPYGFDAAYDLQNIIIKEETIGKIILGNDYKTDYNNSGKLLSMETLKAFYHISDNYEVCEGIGTPTFAAQRECEDALKVSGISASELHQYIHEGDVKNYLNLDIVQAKDASGDFVMDYIFIISTAAGVVIVLLLINFCFDIAVRGIKLGFLELIAPVPIISRLDPKKGKDVFDKWWKACVSTFLDLFIRLLAIYFAIYVIQFLCNSTMFTDNITGETSRGLAKVFVILGALLFARQLPKTIGDIFGFDAKGKFSLNPMKKLKEVPGMEKAMSTAGGAVAGFKAGARVGNPLLGAALGTAKGFNSSPLMGEGKGGFMHGANGAYKSMMGKDFINFQMKPGGAAAANKLKGPKGQLLDIQNQLQSQLTAATSRTGSSAKSLMENGIDINGDLDAAKSSATSNINAYQSQYSSATQALANLKAQASGTKSQQKRAEFEKQILEKQNEISQIQAGIDRNESIVTNIDNYRQSLKDELVYREALGAVAKDLDTISSQKKQVESFYGIDPSPMGDVDTATKNAAQGVDYYINKAKKNK